MKLEELHDRLFEVLCTVDDICKKENVRYFLDSGTAIGAVREHDIIPWDDDVDIKVLREDLPAFKAAMKKNLPEHYHFIEPEEFSPYFYDCIYRVIDDRYPLRTETEQDVQYKNYQNRVGLDVFVYDKAPNGAIAQKIFVLKNKIIYGMGMSKRYQLDMNDYSGIEKLQVAVLALIGKPFSLHWIHKTWQKTVTRWENVETDWRFPSNYPFRDMRFFAADGYKRTVYSEMRGREFPLPAGIDKELTAIYGDYMQPPKDKNAFIKHAEVE
jgi:lipopolysaccharide cholinephosphotransferase